MIAKKALPRSLDQLQQVLRSVFSSEIGHTPLMRLTWNSVPTHLFLDVSGSEGKRVGEVAVYMNVPNGAPKLFAGHPFCSGIFPVLKANSLP